MRRNRTFLKEIYVIVFLIMIVSFAIFFLFPTLNKDIVRIDKDSLSNGENPVIIKTDSVSGQYPISPSVGDYITVTLIAKNLNSIDFPKGTVQIRWKNSGDADYDSSPLNVEKFQIFVDGVSHDYHINIGENPQWSSGKQVSEMAIWLPKVDGVKIELKGLSLKERLALPIDSHINKFFRQHFNIGHVDRFLMPTYLGFVLLCLFTMSLKLVSKKVLTGKVAFSFAAIILVIFSFYYIKNEIFTIKSYFDSHKQKILQADFENTYLGFYDFEKFISWLDENTDENENMIVLVKGEQIYIMSEMTYNLYPKDLKFVDIGNNKNFNDIVKEINDIITDSPLRYNYVLSLSKDDFIDAGYTDSDSTKDNIEKTEDSKKSIQKKFVLEKKYKEVGGYLYRIIN